MSKLNRIQKIILSVIVAFVSMGIILKVISGSTTSNIGYDGISMLKYALVDNPTKTIKDWMSDFSNLWAVNDENDQLRYELSKNPSYKASYANEKQKNEELSKALKIDSDDDRFTHSWANVISRDQTTWNNTITIDKGSKDGMVEGLAVTSVDGLIGKVVSSSSNTSIVKLLTSEDKLNSVSIKVLLDDEKSSAGILERYDVKKGRYVLTLFDDSTEIKKGMQVVTSGNGGVYPSGLLIGTVESVQALINQTGQTIYVKPIDNFQSFEYVSVIVPKGDSE
ncbi:rod shape-determining protein MreC [Amedibacillus sp. YH-ame6]